jgi:hypothetical protein
MGKSLQPSDNDKSYNESFGFEWPDVYRKQLAACPTTAELFYGPQDGLRITVPDGNAPDVLLVSDTPIDNPTFDTSGRDDIPYVLVARNMSTGMYGYILRMEDLSD